MSPVIMRRIGFLDNDHLIHARPDQLMKVSEMSPPARYKKAVIGGLTVAEAFRRHFVQTLYVKVLDLFC